MVDILGQMSVTPDRLLVTITGRDQLGITAELTGVIMASDTTLLDVEQVVVQGQLTLCVLIAPPSGRSERVLDALRATAARMDLEFGL